MVDCGKPDRHLNGCEAGSMMQMREFILDNGLHFEIEYPYKAKKSECCYAQSEPPET